ncbi:hypothetical protein [Fusibacter ferrireducens]|uniref:Uncharacterized protein n=1 Tax=Fusibacter ferrireducens TaxID=2785058 RepID=A0ABR9ZYN3_9FIRM|nr:hypothetical protein [Fusibacter ferrireducens]MBF4695564.1 hypothetical protein [Fusibacter ferrireducens]
MSECICSSCKHLKSIIDEGDHDQNEISETCEFGFPSEDCATCELEGCDLTCENYEKVPEESGFMMSKCSKCGQEIKHMSTNHDEGEIFCVTCYLNK